MNARRLAVLGSVLLYIASLRTPAILFQLNHPGTRVESGAAMLWFSGWGLFQLNFAGVANPLLFVSWFLLGFGRLRGAFVCLLIAVGFALQTFQLRSLNEVDFDEAGVLTGHMLHPLAGWYLWMASLLLPLAAAWLLRRVVPPPAPALTGAPDIGPR